MKSIITGSTLFSQINLLEMGLKENIDVTLHYEIKDFSGNTYMKESETLAVYDQKSINKEFNTEQLPPGDYVLGVELKYSDGVAVASSQFKVREKVLEKSFNNIILVIILSALIFILTAIILIIKRYNNLKKKLKSKNKFYK